MCVTPSRFKEEHQAWASPKAEQRLLGHAATPPTFHAGFFPTVFIFALHRYVSSSSKCFTHKQVVILNQFGSRTAGPEGSNPARLQ